MGTASPVASGPVAFGHRLLRITAEDGFEAQPVVGEDAWLVADARIDNRGELAAVLGIAASELAAMPDSAFILKAWQRWGEECVQHLVGSFAFVVWQPRAERLFLARDHAGDRPLYYRKSADSFLFATTARAIRACPGVSSELDMRQLARDLMGLPPESPRSRFREIEAIAPGHCVVVERGMVTQRRHWRIFSLAPVRYARDEDYVEAFLEIWDEAVRCRLRTDGGVATELSAGLDSGSVAATAAGLMAAKGQMLAAYTSVPCPEFRRAMPEGLIADEGPYAAEVAALYPNMRHYLVDSTGSDMLRELARIYPLLDIPHAAGLNNVWGSLILDRAKAAGAKVMLAGALGNFAFSYSGNDMLHGYFRGGRWATMVREFWRLRRMGLSSGRNAASQTVFSVLPWSVRRRVDPMIREMGAEGTGLNAEFAGEIDAVDQMRRYQHVRTSRLPYLMETQFQCNQYGDYNAATTAGWGIEARDPTADRRVFEFCASIPQEQFVVGGGRSLVRRAMRGRLPDAVLDRKAKGTQAADSYESLTKIRGELKAEVARLEKSPGARRVMDMKLMRDAVEKWATTDEEVEELIWVYQAVLPRGIGVGSFIRRVEAEAAGERPE